MTTQKTQASQQRGDKLTKVKEVASKLKSIAEKLRARKAPEASEVDQCADELEHMPEESADAAPT